MGPSGPAAPRAGLGLVVVVVVVACALAAAPAGAEPAPTASVASSSPPAAGLAVSLAAAREFLVLGTDAEVTISIEVTGPGAETLLPVRTLANVGVLEAPRAGGAPGHFTARYVPPPERYPQVALLVVELAGSTQRLRGTLRLPLRGTTDVPLRTSPQASVTIRVGDQPFGPVLADRQGHVEVPVEVPPGARTGVARAVDRNGNIKETEVDLQPAAFPRVLILAPASLEVGSFAEVTVLALDPGGELAASGRLSLRASEGLVHPLGKGQPGEATFLVEVPRRVGAGALALTAGVAGTPVARADLAVPLVPGPPHALSLSPSARRLVIGGGAQSRVVVSAHDRFGNPTSAEGAEATVDDAPAALRVMASGLAFLVVPPPPFYDGRERIVVVVKLGAALATQEVFLTGGPPAKLSIAIAEPRLVADGWRSAELRVRAFDRNGTPTMIPGLSWDTPGGHIRHVRVPHEGEYIADFVPDRARDVHREIVAVAAGPTLRASAAVEVLPPPVHVVVGARIGIFSNLSGTAGPAAFVEGLTPVPRRTGRFLAGLAIGYLHGDVTLAATNMTTSRLEIHQVPLLAVARYRFETFKVPELAAGAGVGVSLASTRLTPSITQADQTVTASAWTAALQFGGEAAFPLRPGRLVAGLSYLWVDLGRTSHGDYVRGNAAGLMGDLGYRLTW
ncbi:MAG: hypothetical protein JWM82_1641 [Myxococcales bacterium]|nr:hypothetical protein [Myxococcales bacterium]